MCMDLLTVDMIASSSQLLEYPEILHCVLELWAKETLSLKLFCQRRSWQPQMSPNGFFSFLLDREPPWTNPFSPCSFVLGSHSADILHHPTTSHPPAMLLANVKIQCLNTYTRGCSTVTVRLPGSLIPSAANKYIKPRSVWSQTQWDWNQSRNQKAKLTLHRENLLHLTAFGLRWKDEAKVLTMFSPGNKKMGTNNLVPQGASRLWGQKHTQ